MLRYGHAARAPVLMPEVLRLTDEQKKMQQFLDDVINNDWSPGLAASKPMQPPGIVGVDGIDHLLQRTSELNAYAQSNIATAIFGPVNEKRFRTFSYVHAAHHVNFCAPKA